MMEINNNVITFKSLPEFFDKEKTGIKNNTVRKLSFQEAREISKLQQTFSHDRLFIKIIKSYSGESFCRVIQDISVYSDIFIFTFDPKEVPVCAVCSDPIYPLVGADLKKAGLEGKDLYCPGCGVI
jgi:hypothetical protein